jgi:HK97 family phage major capsid protein
MSIENKLGEISQGVEELRRKHTEQDGVHAQAIADIKSEMSTSLQSIRQEMADANAPRMDAQDLKQKADETAALLFTGKFDRADPAHMKAASESNFAVLQNGGFTLPKTFAPEIGELLRKNSIMRGLARNINAGMGYTHLFKTGHGTASKRTELQPVGAGQASTYGEMSFGSAEYYMNVPISVWTTDGDSDVDFASEARKDILAGLADLESYEHMLGETVNIIRVGEPVETIQVKSGLLRHEVVANADRFTNEVGKIGGVETEEAKKISFDDLIRLKASLHSTYQGNAQYIFGSDTETELFVMKDGNGNYVWAIDQAAQGAPATIRGKAYNVTDYMTGTAEATAGSKLVVYGDYSKYLIINQAPISWVVDPITNLRQLKFHARMRQNSGLVDFQAVRTLTNKGA